MHRKSSSALSLAAAGILSLSVPLAASDQPKDPGVRGGPSGAGGPLPGLTRDETNFFNAGLADFQQAQGVGTGLGPRFNLDQCSGCHAQPAVGGTSPANNPEPIIGLADGARNKVPLFVSPDGPVVEARFKLAHDGSPDGRVHSLFVISGRKDSSGDASKCTAVQEDFNAQYKSRNVSLRIPTPVFGAGLIEMIDDRTIIANLEFNAPLKASFGIAGRPNRNGNTQNIARFGWKAQNASLLMFSGEAYSVEMGLSNELFPDKRDDTPSCQLMTVPNDSTVVDGSTGLAPYQVISDIERFRFFMTFLAPPTPSKDTPGGVTSIKHGQRIFTNIGCSLCHTPALATSHTAEFASMSGVDVNLFSDLALHHMGPKLADDIVQGQAQGDDFRTAPLWGLGQRLFFLHDGRTKDLVQTIYAHSSPGNSHYGPSEANHVIYAFDGLSAPDKQDLLNFLRSL